MSNRTLVDTRPREFERLLRVSPYGPFLGILAVAGPMRQAVGGSIVNIASIDAAEAQAGVCRFR